MKVSISIFLITTVGNTFARRNAFGVIKRVKQFKFLMSVKDGSFLDGSDSLDPTVDWGTSTEVGDVDIDYGVRAALSTKEGAERLAWGKAAYDNGNWTLSARGEMDVNLRSSADFELDLLNGELDVSIGVDASVSKDDGLNVKFVELEKTGQTKILGREGIYEIKPRYDVAEKKGELEFGYESEAVSASIVASQEEKNLKLSRKMGDFMPYLKDAKYSLAVSDKKDLTFEYERKLDEDGSLTASFKMNDYAEVAWKDNGWVASAKSKLDGMTPLEPDVRIKRDVSF